MERRRTAVRAEISVYILYIVLALSHSSLELYILYTIHPIHPYILYTIHHYTLPLWMSAGVLRGAAVNAWLNMQHGLVAWQA